MNDWLECPVCLGSEGHTEGDDWIECPDCEGTGGRSIEDKILDANGNELQVRVVSGGYWSIRGSRPCSHTLPQVGVLRELGPLRCVLADGHGDDHQFKMPRVVSGSA